VRSTATPACIPRRRCGACSTWIRPLRRQQERLMNLYNWKHGELPSCVAFGDAFVQANADYGTIIDPAKIVRNTTKMCQTDHCPFWNIGVTRSISTRTDQQ